MIQEREKGLFLIQETSGRCQDWGDKMSDWEGGCCICLCKVTSGLETYPPILGVQANSRNIGLELGYQEHYYPNLL